MCRFVREGNDQVSSEDEAQESIRQRFRCIISIEVPKSWSIQPWPLTVQGPTSSCSSRALVGLSRSGPLLAGIISGATAIANADTASVVDVPYHVEYSDQHPRYPQLKWHPSGESPGTARRHSDKKGVLGERLAQLTASPAPNHISDHAFDTLGGVYSP